MYYIQINRKYVRLKSKENMCYIQISRKDVLDSDH